MLVALLPGAIGMAVQGCKALSQDAQSPAAKDAGVCILATSTADILKGGMLPLAIVLDVAATCRRSEVEVAQVLEAHAAAAAAISPAQAHAMVDVARAHAAADAASER
jgi:hypothetical protein